MSEKNRAPAIGNMSRKFSEICTCETCEQIDRQTKRQTIKRTDMLIAILCSPTGGKVKTHCTHQKGLPLEGDLA